MIPLTLVMATILSNTKSNDDHLQRVSFSIKSRTNYRHKSSSLQQRQNWHFLLQRRDLIQNWSFLLRVLI